MKPGTTAHKEWVCPKCGFEFKNPVPAFEVICNSNKHLNGVAMKPTDPPAQRGRRKVSA